MMPRMDEVLPNVFHWTRVHENLRAPVHSYYVADRLLLIDPMEPEAGLDAVAGLGDGGPGRGGLTGRHHPPHPAAARRLLTDPMEPEAGLAAVAELGDGVPERIVLTVRHHLRHAERFA